VHENIYEEFAARFTDRMSSLRVGNGLDSGTNLGPLVSPAQQERVAALVTDAVTDGATIACGGKKASSVQCGYEATVLIDVPIGARILNEEVFGPVAPLVRFGDTDEVIAHSNSVEHGLVSYVFTQDVGKGMRVAEALETGMVGLNRGLVSDPSAPFGGVKASGIGREGGHDGLLAFLETKYVAGNW
jgi:succinate-semialdehyde dehydrogenase/glutarate-semialdehyde dehydrogenase